MFGGNLSGFINATPRKKRLFSGKGLDTSALLDDVLPSTPPQPALPASSDSENPPLVSIGPAPAPVQHTLPQESESSCSAAEAASESQQVQEEEEVWYPDPDSIDESDLPAWLRRKVPTGVSYQSTLAFAHKARGSVLCGVCGLFYDRDSRADIASHRTEHDKFERGIPFAGWKNEDVVAAGGSAASSSASSIGGTKPYRIVFMPLGGAEEAARKLKISEIMAVAGRSLGAASSWGDGAHAGAAATSNAATAGDGAADGPATDAGSDAGAARGMDAAEGWWCRLAAAQAAVVVGGKTWAIAHSNPVPADVAVSSASASASAPANAAAAPAAAPAVAGVGAGVGVRVLWVGSPSAPVSLPATSSTALSETLSRASGAVCLSVPGSGSIVLTPTSSSTTASAPAAGEAPSDNGHGGLYLYVSEGRVVGVAIARALPVAQILPAVEAHDQQQEQKHEQKLEKTQECKHEHKEESKQPAAPAPVPGAAPVPPVPALAPCSVGVDAVWVAQGRRGHGIAAALVDAARLRITGARAHALRAWVALSEPTSMGLAFAQAYTGRRDVLTYGYAR